MVVAIPSHTEALSSNGTSLTITRPACTVCGSLLIAAIMKRICTTVTSDCCEFTLFFGCGIANQVCFFSRVAGACEPANYTWSWTTSVKNQGQIWRVTGACACDFEDHNACVTFDCCTSTPDAPVSPCPQVIT